MSAAPSVSVVMPVWRAKPAIPSGRGEKRPRPVLHGLGVGDRGRSIARDGGGTFAEIPGFANPLLPEFRANVVGRPTESGADARWGRPDCARFDQDDICEPDRLEKQVDYVSRHSDVSVAGTQLTIIDDADRILGRRQYPVNHSAILESMRRFSPLAHPSVMFRRTRCSPREATSIAPIRAVKTRIVVAIGAARSSVRQPPGSVVALPRSPRRHEGHATPRCHSRNPRCQKHVLGRRYGLAQPPEDALGTRLAARASVLGVSTFHVDAIPEPPAAREPMTGTNVAQNDACRLAVVIPCYRVSLQVGGVLKAIGPAVWRIYCVDDGCPDESHLAVEKAAVEDARIRCLVHPRNKGVGAAVVTGYKQALADGADVIVKLDGDGQMDPARIAELAEPILRGEADYVKGNRFFRLEGLKSMPWLRMIGNAGLSFLAKMSTGYWELFDPTNGYTAIHAAVARELPLDKLSPRYFFESDILFRLNTLRAVVTEVPMDARYADERSSLRPLWSLAQFPLYHARNCWKRILYNYFLRGFSLASINLVGGLALTLFGVVFGLMKWVQGAETSALASAGTVMLAGLPVILGCQLLLNFVAFDMANIPRGPIHRRLIARRS